VLARCVFGFILVFPVRSPLTVLSVSRWCGVQVEPKKHLEAEVSSLLATNIVQCLGLMLDTVVF
jgi:hypothetical protein